MFFYSLITLYFLSKFLFFFKFKKTSLFNSPMFNAFLDTSIIINIFNYNQEFFSQFDIFSPIISLFNKDIEFLNNILYFQDNFIDKIYVLTASHCLFEDGDKFQNLTNDIVIDILKLNDWFLSILIMTVLFV